MGRAAGGNRRTAVGAARRAGNGASATSGAGSRGSAPSGKLPPPPRCAGSVSDAPPSTSGAAGDCGRRGRRIAASASGGSDRTSPGAPPRPLGGQSSSRRPGASSGRTLLGAEWRAVRCAFYAGHADTNVQPEAEGHLSAKWSHDLTGRWGEHGAV